MFVLPGLIGTTQRNCYDKSAAAAPFAFSDLFSGHKGDWWDFTTASRNFTDAGTTIVTALDDLIYRTTGVVNGNYMEQATSGNRGLWKQSDGILLDASTDHMVTPTIPSTITDTTMTFIVVVKINGNNNFQRIMNMTVTSGGSDTGSDAACAAILRNGTAGTFTAYRNGSIKGTQTVSDGVYVLIESEFDGTNHTMTVNGTSGTPVANTPAFGGNNFSVGLAGGSAGDCTIKHAVAINKVLSAGEKSSMRAAYP